MEIFYQLVQILFKRQRKLCKINKTLSKPIHATLGCPHRRLLPANLFNLYLNDFVSENCLMEL